MSGEGMIAGLADDGLPGRVDERTDVIAYLEQRRDNAALMAKRSPEFAEVAQERERQLGVIIEEFRAGLHVGAAIAREALQRWAEPALSAPIETNTFNQEIADGGQA